MIQDNKDLLLKDLCTRLSHGVIGQCKIDVSYGELYVVPQYHRFDAKLVGIKDDYLYVLPIIEDTNEFEWAIEEVAEGINIDDFTPYLRPMSSMTEEERKELGRISCEGNIEHKYGIFYKSQDYLNSIHVDYRGLIPMGLAIEVTKENNPYEEINL